MGDEVSKAELEGRWRFMLDMSTSFPDDDEEALYWTARASLAYWHLNRK